MKFNDYRLKINLKACCMFEQMTGKSFMKMSTDEDVLSMMYCCFVQLDDFRNYPFESFCDLTKDKQVTSWLNKEYVKASRFLTQMNKVEENTTDVEGTKKEETDFRLTDVATSLILKYGMDADYVMYKMDLWEILPFVKQMNEIYKSDMEEKRLWAYINIMPHVDSKKIGSAEKLLPFPWEKDKKNKKFEKNWEKDKNTVLNTLGKTFGEIIAEAQKDKEDGKE